MIKKEIKIMTTEVIIPIIKLFVICGTFTYISAWLLTLQKRGGQKNDSKRII